MSKTLKTILGTMIVIVFLSSCATIISSWEEAKLSYIKDTGVFHLPVIADLDVSPTKITGTASGLNSTIQLLRVRAINNALSTNNADVLLEPRFSFIISRNRTTVTVTGFPASYKNFRSITEQDSLLLKNTNQILESCRYISD